MNSSVKEKEKLRKRLQKLFNNQDVLTQSAAGEGSINDQQRKYIEMRNIRKTKILEDQQMKDNNSKPNKFTSKNVKIQQKSHIKGLAPLTDATKHNGVKKTSNTNGKNKHDILLKKETKLQQTTNRTGTKIKENNSSKQQSQLKKQMKTEKKTVGVKNKYSHKFEKDDFEYHAQRNISESDETSINTQNYLVKNERTKIKNEKKKKKVDKRTALGDILNDESIVSKKKQKLSKKACKINKTPKKPVRKHDILTGTSFLPTSQFENEYDANVMSGFVRGGDFDSAGEQFYIQHSYWEQEQSQNEYSSDNVSECNDPKQKFKQTYQTDLEQYNYNDSFGCEEEYFDSDSDYDNDEFNDYYSDSDETNYSDFDENDYEEDEDNYSYSTLSDNDYFSSYESDNPYDFNDSDDDYKLPKHVVEDVIIHKGTASKRDLKPEDNVSFNSDNEEAQLFELENQHTVKVIYQPKAYEKAELLKLKHEVKSLSSITFHKNKTLSDSEDCPKLVPILDGDDFEPYNPNEINDDEKQGETEEQSLEEYENNSREGDSLGSEYMEIISDDTNSLLSEDINEKYINRDEDDIDSDNSIDEYMWKNKQKVDVIDATGYNYENKFTKPNDNSNSSLNDDIKQILSIKLYENVDIKTDSSTLSTTIIDGKNVNTNEIQIKPTNKSCPESTEEIISILDNVIMDEIQMEREKKAEQSIKISKFAGQSLVDYKTKFFNALDSNLVMVLVEDPFYIYGTVRLTLLAGTVEVYGHSLNLNTEVEIFSPRGCSVIEISSSNGKSNISNENLKQTLETFEQHFALADLKTIVNLYNCDTNAVVLLKRNETRKKVVQQFKKFMNENLFPNINNINVDRPLYNSEYLLRCMINISAQEQKCLHLPEQWSQLNITSKSRVMLAGGRSVGKSTLLRYLINRHVPQQLLLIDLDIGQPEFFIPQTISCTIVKQPILGPGFLLNLQPEISYVVGHTNIALCAHKYIAAVHSLIAHCKAQREYQEIPWLINTMGYNKGFGLELISVIAQEMPLTDIIQLQSNKDINNFDIILHPHMLSSVPKVLFSEETDEEKNPKEKCNYRLHVWQSAVEQESRYQKEWEMSAKDMRYAMLLARLSEALQGHADWLTDIKPLSAPMNELKIINLMNTTPSVQELEKSVEANLVYLCQYTDEFEPLKCFGIGVVRAVDYHIRKLYLVPALPYTQLKYVNCLAIGEMPLPTSLFTNQGSKIKNITPFLYNTIAANTSKAIKQIYHRPRKFLTGKHKVFDSNL